MMNAIVQREFVGLLRLRGAFLVQVMLVAILGVLVATHWPADGQVSRTGEEAVRVFRIFGYGLLAAVIILTPIFPAGSIVREGQSGTLTLLLNSPLSPLAVVMGKLAGSVGYVLVLLVMSMPAAAACWSMGGIGLWSQVGVLYGIVGLAACLYASVGLYVSTRASTTEGAIRGSYVIVFMLVVAVLGPYQLKGGLLPAELSTVLMWVQCVSPVPAVMEVLGQGAAMGQGLQQAGGAATRFVVLAGVGIVILNGMTWWRLSRWLLDRPRPRVRATDERSARVRVLRRIMFLWFFDPHRRAGLIGPLVNPVMVKEFRASKFGRSHWMARLMIGCVIVSLGLMLVAAQSASDWGAHALSGAMVGLQVGLIVLVTPTLACGMISAEREGGGWNLLQMTPLSTFSIISGKMMATLVTVGFLVLATLPGYVAMVLIEPGQLPRATRVGVTLALTTLFAICLSGACSSVCTRTVRALGLTYAILLLLCGGTFLLWIGQNPNLSTGLVRVGLMANPLAACLDGMGVAGFAKYGLLPGAWYFLVMASVVCLAVLTVNTWRLTRAT